VLELFPPHLAVGLAVWEFVVAEVERIGGEKRGAKTIGCVSDLALMGVGLFGGLFQVLGGGHNIIFIEVSALTV
jgi:hypothetical protein